MTTRAPRTTWKDFMPALGAVLVVIGAIYSNGKSNAEGFARIAENTRRIEKLEAKNQLLEQIDRRTTRIEVKLELIAPGLRRVGRGRDDESEIGEDPEEVGNE